MSSHHEPLRITSFPFFDGTNPRLWRIQCLEYFNRFNIHKCMWVVAATMHMEGKAKVWYEAYRLRQAVGDWSEFMDIVQENFGTGDCHQELLLADAVHKLSDDMQVWIPEHQVDSAPHDTYERQIMGCEASLRDVTQMAEPTPACYEEVLTHVGCVSLFIEPCVEPAEVVFSESHHMELEGEVFTTVGGLSMFLECDIGSDEEVIYKDTTWDRYISDPVLTYVGGLSFFLEFDLYLNVASAYEGLQDKPPGKFTALYPCSNTTREGGHCLLADLPHNAFCSGHNGMPSSYLVMDKWRPWSRGGFSPGSSDCLIHFFPLVCTHAFGNLGDEVSVHNAVELNPYGGMLATPRNLFFATQDQREISRLAMHWHSTGIQIQWFSLLMQTAVYWSIPGDYFTKEDLHCTRLHFDEVCKILLRPWDPGVHEIKTCIEMAVQ